jgi:hypothetical protein
MLYWGSDKDDDTRLRWAPLAPANNEILCYLVGTNAANTTLHHEFPLVLTDDPMYQSDKGWTYPPRDCQNLLNGFVIEVYSVVSGVLSQYAQQLAAQS